MLKNTVGFSQRSSPVTVKNIDQGWSNIASSFEITTMLDVVNIFLKKGFKFWNQVL
jgi:hypothetical protein